MSPPRALVTGGAQGIGAATVRALAQRGMAVTIADREVEAGRTLAQEVGGAFVAVDAADPDAIARACAGLPGIEVLVNNVGADQHAFFTDTTTDDWDRLLRINLVSAFAFTSGLLPAMQAARYGRIVCVGSEAGRLGSRGGSVYAAAKAGLTGFARSIARENARYGITCNCVLPGPIETPMVARAIAAQGPGIAQAMTGLTLLGRLGRPEEVAAAIAFLAGPEAGFITGESLGVSGGMGCGAS